jgi:hypothetical protein
MLVGSGAMSDFCLKCASERTSTTGKSAAGDPRIAELICATNARLSRSAASRKRSASRCHCRVALIAKLIGGSPR